MKKKEKGEGDMWPEKRKGKQIKKEKKERKEEERWTELTESEWRERKRKKKVFRFSLRSTEIGPSVFVGARGKVVPRIASYA